MKLRKYRLEDVCNLQIGKTPRREIKDYWGKGYSWVSISDMKSTIINATKEEITDIAINECGCKLIPKGTVLLSFKLSIGKLAYAGKDLFTNEAIVALGIKDSRILHRDYLYYVLKNIPLVGSNNAAMGSTLNKESLRILRLPIPEDISDQLHITDILTKAENLIAKRKESIRLLDEYLKSTFLEMFGDPLKNEMGWEIVSLNDMVTKLGDGLHGTPEYSEDGEYYFINGNNLENGRIRITEATKRVSENEFLKHKKDLNVNSILVSINGTLGRIAFYRNEKVILGKSACYFNLKSEEIIPLYLFHILQSSYFLNYATSKSTGSTISNVSLKTMRELPIPYPPIELQTRFAQIVEKTEALKSQYNQSLQELVNLYGSLSQSAFKGELSFKDEGLMIAAEPDASYSVNPSSITNKQPAL